VSSVLDAERFIEQVGFTAALTDSRRPGPSLYVAVCGRRDAVLPRNVQKDPEVSHAWTLKDQLVRRGKVYYAKLARGRSMFVAARLVPHFHAIWGVRPSQERRQLSPNARAVLKVLRGEWEMASSDLRSESGLKDRVAFNRALDELQAAMIVVPSEAVYVPKFTYLWTLAIGRFPAMLERRVSRQDAVREIARCFLAGAGIGRLSLKGSRRCSRQEPTSWRVGRNRRLCRVRSDGTSPERNPAHIRNCEYGRGYS
jgi:hypothetical protein